MRRLHSIALVLFLITASSFSVNRKQEYRIRTVVIDAGHGGHDSGCLGASSKEKHIALAVALKLGHLIEDNYTDVRVVYTRKTDVFIPLHERADIANRHKADLFICIHCNSGSSKGAFGVETYVMGLHKTEENLAVAKRENAAVLLEEDYKTQYEGFDPHSPEANIIFNLYQNQFFNQSLQFASNVQNQVVEYAGRHNRGVRQAGFLVLYKTAMPSVLIEAGFLTHNEEEKYLLSEKGQTAIATCIYRAFREYKIDAESPNGTIAKSDSKESNKHEGPVKESNGLNKETNPTPVVKKEPPIEYPAHATRIASDTTSNKPTSEKKEINLHDSKPLTEHAPESNTPKVKPPIINKTTDIYITVQIGATGESEKRPSSINKAEGVIAKKSNDGYIRYVVGQFTNVEEAQKKQKQLKALGFSDCFLSAYNGDQKITVVEAVQRLKRK